MVCKNFFSTRPVSEEDCLWGEGHRRTVKELLSAVLRGNTSVILGPRRVGKTSVVSVTAEHFRKGRGHHYIYFNLSRFIGARAISIGDIEPARTSLRLVTTSKSYSVSLKGFSVEVRKTSIEEFTSDFSRLIRVLSENSKRGLLIFDEAQVLSRLKNIDFRELFMEYLNPNSKKAGFMRSAETFTLGRWTEEEGVSFLKAGFDSYGIKASNELELRRASTELGGVPGVISHFGMNAMNLIKSGTPGNGPPQSPRREQKIRL